MRGLLIKGRGALALAAVVAGLAGCGGGSGQQSSTGTSAAASTTTTTGSTATVAAAPATSATTSSSSSSPSSPAPSTSAKATAPGTTLKSGQSAIVEFDTTSNSGADGPSYKLRLTIESITPGSRSDLKGLSLSGVPASDVPTYVKVRMTNLSSGSMDTSSNDPIDSVQAVIGNNLQDALIVAGFFAPCPDIETPNPFAAGQTLNTCRTFMASGPVTKIGYDGSSATLNSPIIWTQ